MTRLPMVLAALMLVGLLFAGAASALCTSTPPVGPADGQARACVLETTVYEDPPTYRYRYDTLASYHVGWFDPANLYVLGDGDVSWFDIASCGTTPCQTFQGTYAFQQWLACTQIGCLQAHTGASQLASAGPGYTYQGTFVGGGAAVGTTYVEAAYFQTGFNGECNEYAEVSGSFGRVDVVPTQPCAYVLPFVDLPPL